MSFFIGCFDSKFRTKDVAEFGTVTISSSNDFLFIVVVIAGREQMAKN